MTVAPVIRTLVPFVHVADVGRAAAFYAQLGFAVLNTHHDPDCGPDPVWVWLQTPGGAELMLALADGPIDHGVQAVLFYLYCDDVVAMREALRDAGVAVGNLVYPFYRPKGEFRVTDPDGYVIMVTCV